MLDILSEGLVAGLAFIVMLALPVAGATVTGWAIMVGAFMRRLWFHLLVRF